MTECIMTKIYCETGSYLSFRQIKVVIDPINVLNLRKRYICIDPM